MPPLTCSAQIANAPRGARALNLKTMRHGAVKRLDGEADGIADAYRAPTDLQDVSPIYHLQALCADLQGSARSTA